MAQVAVFVDDAVRGTLPGVCVKDGMATTSQLIVQDELGDRASLGIGWVLLLLGPLGWLGLLLMLMSRGGRSELLTVQVPMSDAAYQRLRAARRLRGWAAAAGVLGGIVALYALAASHRSSGGSFTARAIFMVAIVSVVAAVITLLVADRRVTTGGVEVHLDASRRWVTLSRVHPAFVSACTAQEQPAPQRT